MKHCQTASMCDNDEIGGDDDDGDGGVDDDDGNLTPSQNAMQDCQSESYPVH